MREMKEGESCSVYANQRNRELLLSNGKLKHQYSTVQEFVVMDYQLPRLKQTITDSALYQRLTNLTFGDTPSLMSLTCEHSITCPSCTQQIAYLLTSSSSSSSLSHNVDLKPGLKTENLL